MTATVFIDDELAEALIRRELVKPLYQEEDGERKFKRGAETEEDRSALYREQLLGVLQEGSRTRRG